MFFNKRKKRKKEMINSINEILCKYDAELILFEYYHKIFGDIVVEIMYKGKKHVFVSGRGEIHHNQEFIRLKSFKEDGHYDPFYFIKIAIENELSK